MFASALAMMPVPVALTLSALRFSMVTTDGATAA
jgi:hypothetical protein